MFTIFVNNLLDSSNIAVTGGIMKISPVVVVARWWNLVAVEVLCRFVLLGKNIRTAGAVLTPH